MFIGKSLANILNLKTILEDGIKEGQVIFSYHVEAPSLRYNDLGVIGKIYINMKEFRILPTTISSKAFSKN